MLDAGQDGRVADLVTVEVQDRQHGSIGNWVEKLVGLPCGRQGARLRFTVADNAGDDQIRIVERGPEGMAERVPQLAAFVNRARSRWSPSSVPRESSGMAAIPANILSAEASRLPVAKCRRVPRSCAGCPPN